MTINKDDNKNAVDKDEKTKWEKLKPFATGAIFFFILITIIFIWLKSPTFLQYIFDISTEKDGMLTLENRAQFGDSFGVINTLFSGLAFLGVIYAIILQQHELDLTRKELKGSRKAQEDMHKTQEIQRFENTFFNLLSLYTNVINSIEYNKQGGKAAVTEYLKSVKDYVGPKFQGQKIKTFTYEDHVQKYDALYYKEYTQLTLLYRNLYRIIKFIDDSSIDEKSKVQYIRILKAQLSNDELLLLFFNARSVESDGKNFRKYIENYNLFENLRFNFTNDQNLIEKFKSNYKETAFKE